MVRAHLYIVVAWSDVLRRYTVKVFPALLANDITPKVSVLTQNHSPFSFLFSFHLSQQVAVSWQVFPQILCEVDQWAFGRLARCCEQDLDFIRLLSGRCRSFIIAKINQAVFLLGFLNQPVCRLFDRLW